MAGAAIAARSAKRGRRVALIEPRPEWGGCFPPHHIGKTRIASGPTLAIGYERGSAADTYCESVGLSLALMIREGAVLARESIQAVWGARRLTVTGAAEEVIEEIRREFRVGEADIRAMFEEVDGVTQILRPRFDPPPGADEGAGAWSRLRRHATARSWLTRWGGISPQDYACAKGWPDTLGDYAAGWSIFFGSDEATGPWIYRLGVARQGIVTFPEGRAGLCRMLINRYESFGGEVVRAPIAALTAGRRPTVEAGGRRFEADVMIINSQRRPGATDPPTGDAEATLAFSVPVEAIPAAMARILLLVFAGRRAAVVRRYPGEEGVRDVLVVACRELVDSATVERYTEELASLLPFAQQDIAYLGGRSHHEVPDPLDAKLGESLTWRPRRWGGCQAGRSPVWWIGDRSPPWIGDARDFQSALMMDRLIESR